MWKRKGGLDWLAAGGGGVLALVRTILSSVPEERGQGGGGANALGSCLGGLISWPRSEFSL